jgi:hypothetical protein
MLQGSPCCLDRASEGGKGEKELRVELDQLAARRLLPHLATVSRVPLVPVDTQAPLTQTLPVCLSEPPLHAC